MLFYVCCWPPFPNTFVHSPLVETILLGWMIYAFKMDGFLRWAFCLWPADPWKRVSWHAPDFPAGDLYFVLPGLDGRPVETLRYEALRMAVQDYELLRMADQVLPPGNARKIFEQWMGQVLKIDSIANFDGQLEGKAEKLYSLDPADYHSAHQTLLQAISRANESRSGLH